MDITLSPQEFMGLLDIVEVHGGKPPDNESYDLAIDIALRHTLEAIQFECKGWKYALGRNEQGLVPIHFADIIAHLLIEQLEPKIPAIDDEYYCLPHTAQIAGQTAAQINQVLGPLFMFDTQQDDTRSISSAANDNQDLARKQRAPDCVRFGVLLAIKWYLKVFQTAKAGGSIIRQQNDKIVDANEELELAPPQSRTLN